MNFVFCSITRANNFKSTQLGSSNFTQLNESLFYYEENNNTKKQLTTFYNECLERFKEKDCIVFCHDDVQLIGYDIIQQLTDAMKQFDVVGVAGCVNPKIIEKNLWHWMCGEKSNYRGFAGHPYDPSAKESFFVTSFGPTPARVAILDGVFLAVKPNIINKKGIKFDETFKFHHYDIDFCLQCNDNNIKMGVWPILINHQSPGLKEFHADWVESNDRFIKKWKNK